MQTHVPVRRGLTLQSRLLLILGAITLLQAGVLGLYGVGFVTETLNTQIGDKALSVAKAFAGLPIVQDAVRRKDSAVLQPLSKRVAEAAHARFVVVGDQQGIRLSHPIAERVGLPMVGGDNEPGLIEGEAYVSKAKGSLGWSMRGKAPVIDEQNGEIIGIVSVGFMLDRVNGIIFNYQMKLLLVLVAALLFSILAAVWVARYFKRAIHGLEPEEIARVLEERSATLESIREGIVSVDDRGTIITFNHAALGIFGFEHASHVVGRPIRDVLPDSDMADVLVSGAAQFDQEVWVNGRSLIVNRVPVVRKGKVRGVVSSFRLKDELYQLSQKLSKIEEYADGLRSQAHEYSNKLHTIAGLIHIGATDEALQLIGQESVDHQSLVELLSSAVPDPVLAGCLMGKYNRAREMGLLLTIDEESSMTEIPLELPRDALVTIIGNLLENALEATLAYSGRGGRVTLSMLDLGPDLIFEIEDQGPGIAEELRVQIFEKGFSSKEGPRGFGLFHVRDCLRKLNGTITIEEAEQQPGSRFIVYVPKQPQNKQGRPRPDASNEG